MNAIRLSFPVFMLLICIYFKKSKEQIISKSVEWTKLRNASCDADTGRLIKWKTQPFVLTHKNVFVNFIRILKIKWKKIRPLGVLYILYMNILYWYTYIDKPKSI